MKSIWTVVALLAVAAIPLIIADKTNEKNSAMPVARSQDDIFEWELSAD